MSWVEDRKAIAAWAIQGLVGVVLFFGTMALNGVKEEIRNTRVEVSAMRADLAAINTRVAIVEAARYAEKIERLEERLRALEAGRKP